MSTLHFETTRYVIDLWGDSGKFLVDCPWGSDDGPPHPRATPDFGKAMHFSDPENARVIIAARLKDCYPYACVRKLVGRWEVGAGAIVRQDPLGEALNSGDGSYRP